MDTNNIVLKDVNASLNVINGNINENNSEQKNVCIDEHLNVLHVSDVQMANVKSYEHCDLDENSNGIKRKRDGDDSERQPPMKKQKVESDAVTFQEKLYQLEKQTEKDKNKLDGIDPIPTADSLYTLLTQSLTANVKFYFLYCEYVYRYFSFMYMV